MNKIVVFVLGPDRPGIIATISRVLFDHGCNLEDVSQTILQGEFLGIFIVSVEAGSSAESLLSALQEQLGPSGLFVHLRSLDNRAYAEAPLSEPFIITTIGPDRPGLVAGITEVLARYNVNITDLKAVPRADQDRLDYIMIYEVNMPPTADYSVLRSALSDRAAELGLDINLQHRRIFEQIHRV
ncbi:MAG TPA: ACT domain-containing protein [Dissulfurispiraceae bacterium]|nr:ACT domain-containing protein [Dissulfurispiraceae bacterium]